MRRWIIGTGLFALMCVVWIAHRGAETRAVRPTSEAIEERSCRREADASIASAISTSSRRRLQVLESESGWTRELRELKTLAQQDPEAALQRADQLSIGEEREAALDVVCTELSEIDP